jgi:GNAT superfamily N-acetyltransferase
VSLQAETRPVLTFQPATAENFEDFESFSQNHGRFRYCRCMRWRMTSSEFSGSSREQRASRMAALIRDGLPVGVLAYLAGEPIGWCSVAPRDTFQGLERSRVLQRVDDSPVWSVTCFFLDTRVRRRGVTADLLRAAIEYARSQGAALLEAYPVDEHARSYRFMGRRQLFERTGFVDITPPARSRVVMRLALASPAQQALPVESPAP